MRLLCGNRVINVARAEEIIANVKEDSIVLVFVFSNGSARVEIDNNMLDSMVYCIRKDNVRILAREILKFLANSMYSDEVVNVEDMVKICVDVVFKKKVKA